MKVRSLAFEILRKVHRGRFAQDLLEETPDLPVRDRALLTQLVYGTIRYQGALDKIIPPNTPLVNRIILRLAGYQLFFLTRIPKYAIVNESVELARQYGGSKSFINAILRKWCNSAPVINDRYNHPNWLVKRWIRLFGKEETERLCEFNNQIAPLVVRINTLKAIPSEAFKQFEKTGHPLGFVLKDRRQIDFSKGFFQAQDISSMYIADLLDVKPGMQVLDLCASPGGKTCHIAQLMDNKGEIIAVDTSREKIELIEENCDRLGITIVKTIAGDGRKLDLGRFDRILVDAPCSNTGVLRRRIEARWRLRPSDFQRLARLQLELLENAARQLKPGGKLVYSTCSIDKSENEEVVEKFLSRNKDFRLVDALKKFPPADNMDGVFGALITHAG